MVLQWCSHVVTVVLHEEDLGGAVPQGYYLERQSV
jgi:hypothetical protein